MMLILHFPKTIHFYTLRIHFYYDAMHLETRNFYTILIFMLTTNVQKIFPIHTLLFHLFLTLHPPIDFTCKHYSFTLITSYYAYLSLLHRSTILIHTSYNYLLFYSENRFLIKHLQHAQIYVQTLKITQFFNVLHVHITRAFLRHILP